MQTPDINAARYGTEKRPNQGKKAEIGSFSFRFDDNGLRRICWNGVEVLRGLSALIRDKNWGNLIAEKMHEEVLVNEKKQFRLTRRSRYLDGALEMDLSFSANEDGCLDADLKITSESDVLVNRAGFTLLHPVIDVAGHPVQVRHGDGNQQISTFPKTISPSQPIFDITGLSHQVCEVLVTINFEGETFEMEDQRNWSDASFKTYCRPLALPFPYTIKKGEVIRQSVRIHLSEGIDVDVPEATKQAASTIAASSHAPDILLAMEPKWKIADSLVGSGLILRFNGEDEYSDDALASLSRIAQDTETYIDVEIIIQTGIDPRAEIERVARRLIEAGIAARHVIALPAAYLKSYQPSGPWPAGPTPSECASMTAIVFPDSRVGVGMLTNFTELNRCRPAPGQGDYLTHGNTAIVHAADDLSVLETLEALPHILESGCKIADGRDYRLGLFAIGMRGNPYGSALSPNHDQERKTMTGDDPRQKGLFAAAYAIGVAAIATHAGIEAVTLGAVSGPFGVTGLDGGFRPIYHAIKGLSSIAGYKVEKLSNMPQGLVGLSFSEGIIAANCSLKTVELKEPPPRAAILDVEQFSTAKMDPEWVSNAQRSISGPIELGPYACLFTGMERKTA